jgi:pyruvate dehydrogenase E2 component (dihydrolipoyllysine-residue acetyltransferase)
MADITMPRLSDTMSEGAVGRWLKKPGDPVKRDEVIAEIETDKATMDLVSFEDGTLQEIRIPEGQVVPIGEVIGVIGTGAVAAKPAPAPAAKSGAAAAAAPQAAASQAASPAPAASAPAASPVPAAAAASAPAAAAATATQPTPNGAATLVAEGERIKASPLARKIAEEHGLDLRSVPGTGPSGRILKANVEEFRRRGPTAVPAPQPATAGAPATARPAQPTAPAIKKGELVPLSRIRRAVARAMSESKPGIPHIYLTSEIDMGAAMALRKQINESGVVESPISPNDLIVKAVARALVAHPQLNASYATTPDGQPAMIVHPQINVSVAVATDNGLLAPVLHDADKKSLGTIAAEVKAMAARAREGSIKQQDLEGATFQTSNLGMFGVTEFVSIITSPQAASLAIGAVRQVPVIKDGSVIVGERLKVTLSVDHRVADGATAAQYLQEVTRLLQAPIALLV